MRLRPENTPTIPLGPASENIIFLDFDGVLNCRKRWANGCWTGQTSSEKIDPAAVERVTRLVKALDAKVVVSSAWRILFDLSYLQSILEQFGFPADTIIDRTLNIPTNDPDGERGGEIQEWLDRHPQVKRFVILDDSRDMNPVMGHLMNTTWEDGLLDHHVERVLQEWEKGRYDRENVKEVTLLPGGDDY